MKKTYVIWILPQAAKKRDGHVNRINSKLENISGSTIERLESYDKSEQIMIYLNKDHDIKNKYEDSDWIKTPLVIFLNNTYDLLIKKEVMKEYGFEEIEKEVKKMCNLGEMIARENIEKGHSMGLEQGLVQGQKLEDIIADKKKQLADVQVALNKARAVFENANEKLAQAEEELSEVKKLRDDLIKQGEGDYYLKEEVIQLRYENQNLKKENKGLQEKLDKAYEFMKKFVIEGKSMLDKFLEWIGEKVREGRGR